MFPEFGVFHISSTQWPLVACGYCVGQPAPESVSVSTYTVTSVSELIGYFVLCLFCEACWARKHLGTWMKSIPEQGPRVDSCKSQHLR